VARPGVKSEPYLGAKGEGGVEGARTVETGQRRGGMGTGKRILVPNVKHPRRGRIDRHKKGVCIKNNHNAEKKKKKKKSQRMG